MIFAGISLELEKVGPTFQSFNPCPPLPCVATDNSKQFQCPDMVLNKKTRSISFEIQLMRRRRL